MSETTTSDDGYTSNAQETTVCEDEKDSSVLPDTDESGISTASSTSDVIPVISPIVISRSVFFNGIDEETISCDNAQDVNTTFYSSGVTCPTNKIDEANLSRPENFVSLYNIVATPQKTHKNNQDPNRSPDLFSDEEIVLSPKKPPPKVVYKEKYLLRQDRKLLRRAHDALIGVSPPLSITHINLSVDKMLNIIHENKHLFYTGETDEESSKEKLNRTEVFLLTDNGKESIDYEWPKILEERYYGLHFNRSHISEELEQLAMKYSSKYVGCETQSSVTVFRSNRSSPSKAESKVRWLVKSPGKRLSHLAKRRITFSNSFQMPTRQIVVDAKRMKLLTKRKSPLKKSPRKTPKKTPKKSPSKTIRTPTSSAKKNLALKLHMMSKQMPVRTKRALFQSPVKNCTVTKNCSTKKISSSPFKVKPESASLSVFPKESPVKVGVKRKRLDSDVSTQPSKISNSSTQEDQENRPNSDANIPVKKLSLSAHHKKKLQWAIFEALKTQNVGVNHEKFKEFATVLVKVTKNYLPDLSQESLKAECGTSERMLRIARQHVYSVAKGKTVEEIIREHDNKTKSNVKPTGYVTLDEGTRNTESSDKKCNILKDVVNIQQVQMPKVDPRKFDRLERVKKAINFDGDKFLR